MVYCTDVVILYMQYVFYLARKKITLNHGYARVLTWLAMRNYCTISPFLRLEFTAARIELPLLEYPVRHAFCSFQHSCVLVQIIYSN